MPGTLRCMPDRPLPHGQHVLVVEGGVERPGLLVAWVRRADGWWGRVVLAADGEASEFLVEAARLRPVG